jgi:hypothetical protein
VIRHPFRSFAAGAFAALVLPLAYWILGLGLEQDRLTVEQVRPVAGILTSIAPAELVLGPLGIWLAGRAAGLRGTAPWAIVVLVLTPLLAIFWLLGLLTLGGALGSGL